MATILELATTILSSGGFTWGCWKWFDKEIQRKEHEKQKLINDMNELYLFWKSFRKKEATFSIRYVLPHHHSSYVVKDDNYTLYIDETPIHHSISVEHNTRGLIMKNGYWLAEDNPYWEYEEVSRANKLFNEFSLHHMFLDDMRTYWENQGWKKQVLTIESTCNPSLQKALDLISDKDIINALYFIFPLYAPIHMYQFKLDSKTAKKYIENIPQSVLLVIKEYMSFTPHYQQQLKPTLMCYLHQVQEYYRKFNHKVPFFHKKE